MLLSQTQGISQQLQALFGLKVAHNNNLNSFQDILVRGNMGNIGQGVWASFKHATKVNDLYTLGILWHQESIASFKGSCQEEAW